MVKGNVVWKETRKENRKNYCRYMDNVHYPHR